MVQSRRQFRNVKTANLRGLEQGRISTAGDLDRLLGISSQQRILGTARSFSSAEELAGQTRGGEDLSQDDAAILDRFFSGSLSGEQQAQVQGFAGRAVGQGLIGGAVSSQVERLSNQLTAQNRVSTFGRANELVQGALSEQRAAINPFFNFVGNLSNQLGGAGEGNLTLDLLNGTGAAATSALRALSAVGLGGDAIRAVGQARGVNLGVGGGPQSGAVGQNFLNFLTAPLSGRQQQQMDFLRRRPGARSFQGRRALAGTGALNLGLSRLSSGQALANQIQAARDPIESAAAQLQTFGLTGSLFEQTRDQGLANAIAGADFSAFGSLFGGLGVTPRRTARSTLLETIGS